MKIATTQSMTTLLLKLHKNRILRQPTKTPAPSNPTPHSFRNVGINNSPQALTLTKGDKIFMDLRTCPIRYANAFLHGTWTDSNGMTRGEAPGIGTSGFLQRLNEAGIQLPENAHFNITLNRYGRVTITGLEDKALTQSIEEALSYDRRQISQLGTFVRSAKILQGTNINNADPFTQEQSRLIRIQSDLKSHNTSINDLTLQNGKIQGLPQTLHDKIYGDRAEWLNNMNPTEAKWENWNINRIRDDILHFLKNGTSHIPDPNISLTFANGRITTNTTHSGGGINITA